MSGDGRYAQSGQGARSGHKMRNPWDRIRVRLDNGQRGRLDHLLAKITGVAVAEFGRTVAGTLLARTREGEVRRLRLLHGALSEGDVFTADQVRHLLMVTRKEADIHTALQQAWEGEEEA